MPFNVIPNRANNFHDFYKEGDPERAVVTTSEKEATVNALPETKSKKLKNHMVNTYLDQETFDMLMHICEEEGLSQAAYVRNVIRKAIKRDMST